MNMHPQQFFYGLIVSAAILVAGMLFGYSYGINIIDEHATNVSKAQAEYNAQQEIIRSISSNEIKQEQIDEIQSLLDNLLPRQKNQQTLVADIIYTATAEASIPTSNITSFAFSGSNQPDEFSGTSRIQDINGAYEYPFTLNLQEISYNALLQLLREVESNGRIIQVANVSISPDGENPNQLSAVTLSMKAFLQP